MNLIHCDCIYFTYAAKDVKFAAVESFTASYDAIVTSLSVVLMDAERFLC